MPRLSVNIDHVATIREARRTWEPDPILAAREVELGGADGITVHLREDRRHIQDSDVERLRSVVGLPLNFEMAATEEMVAFALRIRPQSAMLVPEGRREITTEGGLDVAGSGGSLRSVVDRLAQAGIATSVFIDADERQIESASKLGVSICEVHTGPYSRLFHEEGEHGSRVCAELARITKAGLLIRSAGMRFNAGHALNYENTSLLAALSGLFELHIGHSIVSRALFVGLRTAVTEMRSLCGDEPLPNKTPGD